MTRSKVFSGPPTAAIPDPPAPPRYVDALGQDADATAAHPVVPPDAPPSARTATRLLTVAVARDAGLATRGLARSARRDPTAAAAWLAIGLIVGIVVARWRLAPDAQPVYASPAQATIAATATAAVDAGTTWTQPADVSTFAASTPTSPDATGLPVWLPATVTRWAPEIRAAAEAHGVDPALVAVVVTIESCGYAKAMSPAGAAGLMQVVPKWHPTILDGAGPQDPAHNLDVGTAFLADLLKSTQGDYIRAACQYNGGGNCASLAESQRYMTWIKMYGDADAPTSATYDQWRAAVDATPGNMCAKAEASS